MFSLDTLAHRHTNGHVPEVVVTSGGGRCGRDGACTLMQRAASVLHHTPAAAPLCLLTPLLSWSNDNRSDGKATHGFALLVGRRPQQEDCAVAEWTPLPNTASAAAGGSEQVGLFAVMDGHGGAGAAQYVQANLFKALLGNDNFPGDAKAALGGSAGVWFWLGFGWFWVGGAAVVVGATNIIPPSSTAHVVQPARSRNHATARIQTPHPRS